MKVLQCLLPSGLQELQPMLKTLMMARVHLRPRRNRVKPLVVNWQQVKRTTTLEEEVGAFAGMTVSVLLDHKAREVTLQLKMVQKL